MFFSALQVAKKRSDVVWIMSDIIFPVSYVVFPMSYAVFGAFAAYSIVSEPATPKTSLPAAQFRPRLQRYFITNSYNIYACGIFS